MYDAIVYLKGYYDINGEHTNNFDVRINHLDEIDDILSNFNITPEDITVIDFR